MKMSPRFLLTAAALLIAVASVSPAVVSLSGQAQPSAAATWTPPKSTYNPPRTPWGDPDLQGVWDYQSRLPMQRPPQLKDKATLTDAELAAWVKTGSPNQDPCGVGTRENEECTPDALAEVGAYNEFWNNRNIVKDNRTSLILDPPDGRFPPMTSEAQKRQAAVQAARSGGDRAR